jgi:MFS family permease
VLFAIALISVTFFGDGALESFLSTYLQRTLAGGVLLSGIGIGSYHFASLLGRLTATALLRRFGERRVVTAAGLLAATGLLTAVMAPDATGAIGGLLLVGFAIAPVVPTTLSLAGRSAPGRSGQAVATATAVGYGSFILSPLYRAARPGHQPAAGAGAPRPDQPGHRGPGDPLAGLPARLSTAAGWPAPRLLASSAVVRRRGNPARAAGRHAGAPCRARGRAAR